MKRLLTTVLFVVIVTAFGPRVAEAITLCLSTGFVGLRSLVGAVGGALSRLISFVGALIAQSQGTTDGSKTPTEPPTRRPAFSSGTHWFSFRAFGLTWTLGIGTASDHAGPGPHLTLPHSTSEVVPGRWLCDEQVPRVIALPDQRANREVEPGSLVITLDPDPEETP